MSISHKNSTFALIAIFATLGAYAMSVNVIPPLITTISSEFKIDYASFGGYVVSLQYLCFAAASICSGWLSHRFGLSNRSLMIIGIFLMAVVMASASTFGSFKWFLIWAIPLGIGGSLIETFNSIMLCRIGGPDSSKMMNSARYFLLRSHTNSFADIKSFRLRTAMANVFSMLRRDDFLHSNMLYLVHEKPHRTYL